MSFTDTQLSKNRPASVRGIDLPRRGRYPPSHADWRDETPQSARCAGQSKSGAAIKY